MAPLKHQELADRRLVSTKVGDLSWVAPPNPSACGCVWRRCAEFGDVITEQCFEHALDSALSAITGLAEEVARNRKTPDEVAARVADECTRLGPGPVQLLEQFFESEVNRIRYGKVRHS